MSSTGEVSLAELFAGRDPAASSGRNNRREILQPLVTGGWPQKPQHADPRFVVDYLDALERLLILEEQSAFNIHLRSSRNLRTTPHRHLVDPSLATAALQVDADGLSRDLNYTGLLFESLVVPDLRVLSQPLDASARRTSDTPNSNGASWPVDVDRLTGPSRRVGS